MAELPQLVLIKQFEAVSLEALKKLFEGHIVEILRQQVLTAYEGRVVSWFLKWCRVKFPISGWDSRE